MLPAIQVEILKPLERTVVEVYLDKSGNTSKVTLCL
jgi:hypothetical protein